MTTLDDIAARDAITHVPEWLLRQALLTANDQATRYWCWIRDEYERADALRCHLSTLLGEPRERQPWPSK